MRRFVIGDLHGRYEALMEVLEKSKFDREHDKLILLGDLCDGGDDTFKVVEELLKIKNLVLIKGNHDDFFLEGINHGFAQYIWLSQGGLATLKSYGYNAELKNYGEDQYFDILIPITHQEFFNSAKYYHIEDDMIFVHGGFIDTIPIEANARDILLWDRDLWHTAQHREIMNSNKPWKKVFIGHTTTQSFYDHTDPLKFNNLWMCDTGAGWNGRLTIMDIDSEEYWQSKLQEGGR